MKSNANIICTTRFKAKISFAGWIISVIWWLVVIGLFLISGPGRSYSYESGLFGESYESRKIWGYTFYSRYHEWNKDDVIKFDLLVLILGILFTILLISLPFINLLMKKSIVKRCSLDLLINQIEGQHKTLFTKKKLSIPIAHLDNAMTSNGLLDILRGGESLLISSNSGIIKFHFVQNAEEFAQAAMKRIEEEKKAEKLLSVQAHSFAENAAVQKPLSPTDEIKKLKELLDMGAISQEEFETKKAVFLSKI